MQNQQIHNLKGLESLQELGVVPVCPILRVSDEWVYTNFRNAKFVRYLKWVWLASSQCGNLSIKDVKEICKAQSWNFETEKKVLYWAASKSWASKSDENGSYNFKSLYGVFKDLIGVDVPNRKAYQGVDTTQVPAQALFLKPAEFRAYFTGKYVKKFKGKQLAQKAILSRHEENLNTFGYWIKEYTDMETGERKKVRLGKEDMRFEKARLGETWSPDLVAYERYLANKGGTGGIEPKAGLFVEQYNEHLRLPFRTAQVGGVNLFGATSKTTYGNYYTEVIADSPITVENVVAHPAVIVGQHKEERKSNEGSSQKVYVGKVERVSESNSISPDCNVHKARIYKGNISFSEFAKTSGLSVATIGNYSKTGFAGTVLCKTTEVVLGLYDPTFISWFNNKEYGMNRAGVPHDTWGYAVRRKANSMLKRKKADMKRFDILVWGNYAIDWNKSTHVSVIKFKTCCFLVDTVVKRTDLHRLGGKFLQKGEFRGGIATALEGSLFP